MREHAAPFAPVLQNCRRSCLHTGQGYQRRKQIPSKERAHPSVERGWHKVEALLTCAIFSRRSSIGIIESLSIKGPSKSRADVPCVCSMLHFYQRFLLTINKVGANS